MRYNESVLSPNYFIKVVHLHKGNSTNEQRHNHHYVTLASVYAHTGQEQEPELICIAKAICSKKDNPSRRLGRHIAVGRAIKHAVDVVGEQVLVNAA